MTLIRESRIYSLFALLYSIWAGAWNKSVIGHAFHVIRLRMGESAIFTFIRKEGAMDKAWKGSLFFRFCDFICNLIPNIFKAIYKAGEKLFGGSVIISLISAIGDRLYLFLGLFFAVLIIVPHDYWNNAYALAAVLLLFLVYCFACARSGKRVRADKAGPFMPIMLIMVVYACVSSISISLSFRFLLFYITAALIVLLVVTAAEDKRKLTVIVAMVLAAVALAGVYACYQRVAGVKVVANQVDLTLELNKNMPGRVYGTFGNPNNFAELLVLTIPFFIAMFLNAKTWRGKTAAFIGALPALAAIAMTYSRSGWIGLVLAVLIFAAFKNWRVLPVIIIIGLLLIPVMPQSIVNRILTIGNLKDSSTSYRFLIFGSFSQMMKDVWARGIGLGSDVIFIAIKSYKQLINGHYPVHAHNNYIQMLVEMGILGLLSYLAMMLNTFKRGIKLAVNRKAVNENRNFAIAGFSGLAGLLVISVAEYTWFYPRVMFAFWLVLAITMAACKMGGSEGEKPLGVIE